MSRRARTRGVVLPALVLVLVPTLLAACGILRGRPMHVEHARGVMPTGVLWRDTRNGLGPTVAADSVVTIHYTARVHEGPEIDSTYGRGVPETMSLADPVVPGLTEGLAGMRVGGRRLLVIPPDRAFGSTGIPDLVPPYATVDFHVELVGLGAPEPPPEETTAPAPPTPESAAEGSPVEGE